MKRDTFFMKDGTFFVVCLAIGSLAEELLFRGVIGISGPIFIVIFYFVFFLKLNVEGFLNQRFNLLVFLCIWCLAFSYMLYTNPILRGLNYLILPILILIQITLTSSDKNLKWYEISLIRYIFLKIGKAIKYNLGFMTKTFRAIFKGMNEQTFNVIKRVIVGLCIAVPFGLVVTSLLMSADLKFANLINQFPQWSIQWIDQEMISRLILILIITLGFFGYFQVSSKKDVHLKPFKKNPLLDWDGVVALTVLIMLNGVYTLFALVQFKYFFGQTLQGDLTYAVYARRGFAELVVVTVLNLTVLVSVISFVKVNLSKLWLLLQIMLSLLVASSGILLVSAYIRLLMYEEAYGFTMLRLLVQAFMIFLTLTFIYTLITIWVRRLSLIRFYLLSSVIFYTLLNVVPLDQIVIQNNLSRFEQTGKLDVDYLNRMSSNGVMCLINLYKKNPTLPGLQGTLERDQSRVLNEHRSWQSFNIQQQQADKLLKELDF